jgi:hypothetical protein
MNLRFACWLLLLSLASHCFAADQQGRYFIGGGVGATTCPQFLNAMANARQAGGVSSPAGANLVTNFYNYVAGFQTGYNVAAANGVSDIFAKIDMQHWDALFAIEGWCKDHPAATFGEGVVALAQKLKELSPPQLKKR